MKPYIDSAENRYRSKRIANWDRISKRKSLKANAGVFYHSLLRHYYRFMVPPGLKVLELGCGHGDLLASLEPALGVGVDFSEHMLETAAQKHPDLRFVRADVHGVSFSQKFDVVILSDLVNDLWDVQKLFENIRAFATPETRIILNYYNNIWRAPLSATRRLGLSSDILEQNWFSPNDVSNLLKLSGFETVKSFSGILLPLRIPILADLANRYVAKFPPFKWFVLTNFVIARATGPRRTESKPSVSVIVPARNEAGHIENIIRRVPDLGRELEIIFVEGNSSDNTYETIEQTIPRFPEKKCGLYRQTGKGKGDAVRLGFDKARGDILMILDADMTVPPEDLGRFVDALVSGKGEFINGVRLVYPMEDEAMRFFNILGNKFFSLAFSWLLGQSVKDTLCGTKVMWKRDYEMIAENRHYFGDFDPFGDFDLLFGAAKLNLKIAEMPIRYRSREYGDTNIDRWRHGWLLLKMVLFAAKRIKFV